MFNQLQKYPFDLYPRCAPASYGVSDGRLATRASFNSALGLHMGQAAWGLMYNADPLTQADLQYLGPVAVGLICWWLQAPVEYLIAGEAKSHAYCTGREVGRVELAKPQLTLTMYTSRRGRWVVGSYAQSAAGPADTWVVASEA